MGKPRVNASQLGGVGCGDLHVDGSRDAKSGGLAEDHDGEVVLGWPSRSDSTADSMASASPEAVVWAADAVTGLSANRRGGRPGT